MMVGQWLLTLMHHTRGLFLFQDLENPSNRNAPFLSNNYSSNSVAAPNCGAIHTLFGLGDN